jgi:hypothetical protein
VILSAVLLYCLPVVADLGVVADAKANGTERATAIRAYMSAAKAEGRCADAAKALDAVIVDPKFPAWLRRVGAEAIATCGDEATAKYLAPLMLRGDTYARLHALRAARGHAFPIVWDSALRLVNDKEPRVRCEAIELLERQSHAPAAERLSDLVAKGKDREGLEPALRAVSTLRRDSPAWPAWETQLEAWSSSDKDATRQRAALAVLLGSDDARRLPLALRALQAESWSLRVLALQWLSRNPTRGAMDALVARLAQEEPGSRLSGDLDSVLGQLTGMGRFDTAQEWSTWWANHQADWQAPTSSAAPKTQPAPAGPTLGTGHQAAKFYGIEVVSRRTIYIVDLSGSMNEPSKSAGSAGRLRIDVAKTELLQLVDSMPAGSWFNIIGFHDGVYPWLDSLAVCVSPKYKKRPELLRSDATEQVRKLVVGGSTNIYDAFARAFEDPDVDTICFMTDGTPTIGTETEAIAIREELQRWNRSRRVRIHCIAVGEDNSLPKWIAQDHEGVHTFLP